MNPITAQLLLLECTGDDIWSESTCREKGVPETWIAELIDCYESGFDTARNTIYEGDRMVNQYRGVLDIHLAYKLAEFLGIDWKRVTANSPGRKAEVSALKEELDEI